MDILKPVLKFFGIFCLSYILLYFALGKGPAHQAHRSFFMTISEPFLQAMLPKTTLSLKEGIREEFAAENQINVLYNNKEELDRLIAEARKNPNAKELQIKSYETTLLFQEGVIIPIIFLLSLIIATPLKWKEKLMAILVGLLCMYIFILFKTWIYTLHTISVEKIGVYEFTPPLSSIVSFFGKNLRIGASTIVGTLIWVLVAVRKTDWRGFWNNSFLEEKK